MEKIIIFGAGNMGKRAYEFLKSEYDVLFFVDNDDLKLGGVIDGKKIKNPSVLKEYRDTKVVITPVSYEEILLQLEEYQLKDVNVYGKQIVPKVIKELDERTIDLGAFLAKSDNLECKELTFLVGGSGVLDYMFLREIAKLINCRVYLEIGTYIGESINILTDICEKLYSITAEPGSQYSMQSLCRNQNIPDYSERLAGNRKIEHFYCDSKKFDFSQIVETVDLYFIDGDHSYVGVYNDTKNIFESREKNSVIIWHDFKEKNLYRPAVINAVKDALGDEFENVYVTNNNLCGIYLPECLKEYFTLIKDKYEKNAPLFVYDTKLTISIK